MDMSHRMTRLDADVDNLRAWLSISWSDGLLSDRMVKWIERR